MACTLLRKWSIRVCCIYHRMEYSICCWFRI